MFTSATIQTKYVEGFRYLNNVKTKKHIKGYDLLDHSKLNTTSKLRVKDYDTTRYINYNHKRQPLKSVIYNLKKAHKKFIINNMYLIVEGLEPIKIYYSNKLLSNKTRDSKIVDLMK